MNYGDVLVRVVPLALAAAIAPFNVSVVILMLLSKDYPIARAFSFIAGFAVSMVLVGTIVVSLLASVSVPFLRPPAYLIVIALGVLLLMFGARQWVFQADPDEPLSAWMQKVSSLRPF